MTLRTTQKRAFVDALESFSVFSFEENLTLKEERNKYLLGALSYNRLSKSEAHKKVVKKLRDGELKSWKSKLEEKISLALTNEKYRTDALNFISTRPGEMIRSFVRLYRLGYTESDLLQYCVSKEFLESISYQTLISNLQYFGQDVLETLSKKKIYSDNELTDINFITQKQKEFDFAYSIFSQLLLKKMTLMTTPLKNKKVYIDEGAYDLNHSIVETNNKNEDDTYFRSGLAFAIPKEVNKIRFFVYWNHKYNIDIDLYATAWFDDNSKKSIGYFTDYSIPFGLVYSGDIRHSNSAEYIDIDIEKAQKNGVEYVDNIINIYSGANSFNQIDTIYAGMMAVKSDSKSVKLYNSENVFFRHDLISSLLSVNYAYIDIKNRCLRLNGKRDIKTTQFSLKEYLNLLKDAQNINFIENKEEAEIILTIGKVNDKEKEISLLDNNFFIDYE